jgi:hypothetical protein
MQGDLLGANSNSAFMTKNEWHSWKTQGAWLSYGQKQKLDDIGAAIIVLIFVGIYIWIHVSQS